MGQTVQHFIIEIQVYASISELSVNSAWLTGSSHRLPSGRGWLRLLRRLLCCFCCCVCLSSSSRSIVVRVNCRQPEQSMGQWVNGSRVKWVNVNKTTKVDG